MKKLIIIISIILAMLFAFYLFNSNKETENPNIQTRAMESTDNSISGIDSITTDNYANTTLEYYYYIPEQIKKSSTAPFLIMVPGLSGRGQDFVNQRFKDFAKQEGFVIIAPSFIYDEKNWDNWASYQFPAAWSGKALNNILNSFMAKQEIHASTLYMFGFSAGAQFVSRYAMLYPGYVTACAFNAAGGTDNPLKYQATKFYVAIGAQDEDVRKQTAQDFYNLAQKQGIDVTVKEYENVGHALSAEEINDELAFFSRIKAMTKIK